MQHFFIPPQILRNEPILLQGPLAQQLSRVLRLHAGDHVVLLDDSGWAHEVELQSVAPSQCMARVVARWQPHTELSVRLVLYQSLTREQKFDWVLQKATELGVAAFVPLLTARGLIQRVDQVPSSRLVRWQRVVTEAAEQSGRARLPQILPIQDLDQACASLPQMGLTLIACPAGEVVSLGHTLRADLNVPEIRLLIGPEGGFTAEEVDMSRRAGAVAVSLGPRTLRTETAGLVLISAILYALGEMG